MKYPLYVLLFFLFASCSSTPLEIDNPSNKALEIKIGDNDPIMLKAYENKTIFTSSKEQEVFVDGVSKGIIQLTGDKEYFLNPTLAKYYIEKVTYGQDIQSTVYDMMRKKGMKLPEKKDEIEMQIFEFGDFPYIGNAKVDSNLLIKKIWSLGVHDKLPKQVKTTGSSAIRKKIYREEFFIKHAEAIYKKAMKE